MNKDKLQKWVAALESGKYTQIVGRLRRDNVDENYFTDHDQHPPAEAPDGPCFCALGVVVELAIEDGVDVEWDHQAQQYTWIEPRTEDDSSYRGQTNSGLPRPVWDWLGIEYDDFAIDEAATDVVTANDEERRTFTEIAAAAKAYYELEKS